VWEGDGVVKAGRVLLGATKPSESAPGSIRGDYCIDVGRNIVNLLVLLTKYKSANTDAKGAAGRNICHGSDAVDSANKEIALWFTPDELCDWASHSESWVYE
jgi:nucleoside-diphosphate kinase